MRRVPRLNRFNGRGRLPTSLQVALCLELYARGRSRALLIISVLCLLGIGLDFVAPDISIIEGASGPVVQTRSCIGRLAI